VRALPLVVSALLIASFAPYATAPVDPPSDDRSIERVAPNDNRRGAGASSDGVHRLSLEVRLAEWRPDGDDAPGATVPLFAEVGRPATVPGPMLRVRAGTIVEVTVRNSMDAPLTVRGLQDRVATPRRDDGSRPSAVSPGPRESGQALVVAPGATASTRFRLDVPGTFYYYASLDGRSVEWRTGIDAQLSGAIVVDAPGARTDDRVFVLGMWTDTVARAFTRRTRVLGVINGRSWPGTERLTMTQGDSATWRVINASGDLHPMHLHGTYFRLLARGDGIADTLLGPALQDLEVTEMMLPGATMTMAWRPDRAGNWLFHCHIPEHFGPRGSLGMPAVKATAHDHAAGGMRGLVLGVTATPRARGAATDDGRAYRDARHLRLLVRRRAGGSDTAPVLGYALQERGARPDTGGRMPPAIVLTRGVPVRITVVNTLDVPTAVHWHGMELDSYYDGVPGFSGAGSRVSPVIAPHDSFEVRFTPPRAGTFIYHTHVDEERQTRGGLAAPLIVLEPGARHDPRADHVVLLGTPMDWKDEQRTLTLNGRLAHDTFTVVRGVPQRVRFINMTNRRTRTRAEFRRDTALLAWRVLAMDGADLPAARRVPVPGWFELAVGQTRDVELVARDTGTLRIDLRNALGAVNSAVVLRVVERAAGPR
jgi:FtsP/CotA-like multicopper oxidase with cupredoxin domain